MEGASKFKPLTLHCEEVENGKVAVDYFKQGRTYDLVLMDKEMPVMDGHEETKINGCWESRHPLLHLQETPCNLT